MKINNIKRFEGIRCVTLEDSNIIHKLLGLSKTNYTPYGGETIIYPKGNFYPDKKLCYGSIAGIKDINTIYKASDFIEESVNMEIKKEIPELKSGNIVELKDQTRGLVFQTPNGKQYIYWYKKESLVSYSTTYTTLEKGVEVGELILNSIDKVYEGITDKDPFAGINLHKLIRLEAIWTKPNPVVELTLQQIADKFGVNIKNLSIKEYQE